MSSVVYGICHHSLVFFHDHLSRFCKENDIPVENIQIVENHNKNLPKSKVLVFADYNSLYTHRKLLQGRKSIVFVVDSLPQLYGIDSIEFLDCEGGDPGISYQFCPSKLERAKLRKALKPVIQARKPERIEINPKKFEIIPNLIRTSKEGMVLDKLNNMVYRTADLKRRETIRALILSCLVGQITVEKLGQTLRQFVRKGLGTQYLDELLGFLHSAPGQNYIKVLSQVFNSGKKVRADKLAADYGVDAYEVRYLSKMWKNSSKDIPESALRA